jgi:hypothetical protein
LTVCLVGLEILSLAIIIPLMDLILNQNLRNKFLFYFIQRLNFEKIYSLENILIIFIIIYFIKTIFSIIINFFNYSFYLNITYFVKKNLLKIYLKTSYKKFLSKNSSQLLVDVNQTTNIFA